MVDMERLFQSGGKIGLAVFDANKPVYFDNVVIQGKEVFPFPPLSYKVDPGEKLASFWGQIKIQ